MKKEYHLKTGPGDLAGRCLLVGSPDRAKMIGDELLEDARELSTYRGLRSVTGYYRTGNERIPVSVVTTGMGSASTGIVLPEAVKSGGRIFIRVGSCGAIQPEADVGDAIICTAAARYDGASEDWAPIQYPAAADWRVVLALVTAADKLGHPHHVGIGATTTCFNEGQARPDPLSEDEWVPPHMQYRHEWLKRIGVLFYSMEEATLFTWCSAHGGYPAGAVDAVFANRTKTTEATPGGEKEAALIALEAIALLDPVKDAPASLRHFRSFQ